MASAQGCWALHQLLLSPARRAFENLAPLIGLHEDPCRPRKCQGVTRVVQSYPGAAVCQRTSWRHSSCVGGHMMTSVLCSKLKSTLLMAPAAGALLVGDCAVSSSLPSASLVPEQTRSTYRINVLLVIVSPICCPVAARCQVPSSSSQPRQYAPLGVEICTSSCHHNKKFTRSRG